MLPVMVKLALAPVGLVAGDRLAMVTALPEFDNVSVTVWLLPGLRATGMNGTDVTRW